MIFSDLITAYKFDKRFKTILLSTIVAWSIIFILSIWWFGYTDAIGGEFFSIYGQLDQNNLEEMQGFSEDLLSLVVKVLAVTIAVVILIYGILTAEKTITINQWAKKKLTSKLIFRTMLARLIWFLPWLAPIILLLIPLFAIQSAFQANSALLYSYVTMLYINLAFWLVISYYGNFFYNNYLHHQKIFKSIGKAFSQGTKQIVKAVPRLIISLIVLVLYFLLILFLNKINLSFLIINLLLFIYILTGLRIYVLEKLL